MTAVTEHHQAVATPPAWSAPSPVDALDGAEVGDLDGAERAHAAHRSAPGDHDHSHDHRPGVPCRWDGVTLLGSGTRPDLPDLVMTVDGRGLSLRRPAGTGEDDRWRVLPWASVTAAAARPDRDRPERDAIVLVRTTRRTFRLWLPAVDPRTVAASLQRVAPAGLPIGRPKHSATEPAALAASTPSEVVPAPPTPVVDDALGVLHSVPAPALPPASARTSSDRTSSARTSSARHAGHARAAHRPIEPAPAFHRVRPVLTVVLVAVVAAMVALVLAESVGAIHLAWLGSTGAGRPSSLHGAPG